MLVTLRKLIFRHGFIKFYILPIYIYIYQFLRRRVPYNNVTSIRLLFAEEEARIPVSCPRIRYSANFRLSFVPWILDSRRAWNFPLLFFLASTWNSLFFFFPPPFFNRCITKTEKRSKIKKKASRVRFQSLKYYVRIGKLKRSKSFVPSDNNNPKRSKETKPRIFSDHWIPSKGRATTPFQPIQRGEQVIRGIEKSEEQEKLSGGT